MIKLRQKQMRNVQKGKEIQFQCMSNTGKSSPEQTIFGRKKANRNLMKKKITLESQNDELADYMNPFSQELSPWNEGGSRLQGSTNLLKMQSESKALFKNFTESHSVKLRVEPVAQQKTQNPPTVAEPSQPQQKKLSDRYAYPRLKVYSQQVVVSKSKKEQPKRLLFSKKPSQQSKQLRKIANLTMQWDQDIVYNPQKKYFDEKNLKRKILREFVQSKNQSLHQSSRRQLKGECKTFKQQFKNNRIHKKQIATIEFKKNENSNNQSNQMKDQNTPPLPEDFLSPKKRPLTKNAKVKVSNISFQPLHSRAYSPEHRYYQESNSRGNLDKWRFRSSLRVKREKNDSKTLSRTEIVDMIQFGGQFGEKVGDGSPVLNRITIGVNEKIYNHRAHLQLLSRTAPNFFKTG